MMRDRTRFSLGDGVELAGVELSELWWRYVAIGGSGDPASLAVCLLEDEPCDQQEHDTIAQALNEAFLDRGHDTFPVAYAGRPARVPTSKGSDRFDSGNAPVSVTRSLEARRRAAVARMRSAAAARRSAQLHATAAQLMQASGQLQFARRAETRAQAARRRAASSVAA